MEFDYESSQLKSYFSSWTLTLTLLYLIGNRTRNGADIR
jgi:hypothetical protein